MNMTNREIKTSFMQAKNRKSQLQVLADLNSCSRTEIKEILLSEGVPEEEIPKFRASRAELNLLETKEKDMEEKEMQKTEKTAVPNLVKKVIIKRMEELSDQIDAQTKELKILDKFIKEN